MPRGRFLLERLPLPPLSQANNRSNKAIKQYIVDGDRWVDDEVREGGWVVFVCGDEGPQNDRKPVLDAHWIVG